MEEFFNRLVDSANFACTVLGSCARPCNSSYLTSLCNTAGLTSPALYRKEAPYGSGERGLLRGRRCGE